MAWELALRAGHLNGQGVAPDAQWLLARLSLNAPRTAAHLPRVLAAIGPEAAAAVRRLAGERVTPPVAEPAQQPAESQTGELDTSRAARLLGVGEPAVRAAIARGKLPATKGADGRWRIGRDDVETYGRAHGNGGSARDHQRGAAARRDR